MYCSGPKGTLWAVGGVPKYLPIPFISVGSANRSGLPGVRADTSDQPAPGTLDRLQAGIYNKYLGFISSRQNMERGFFWEWIQNGDYDKSAKTQP